MKNEVFHKENGCRVTLFYNELVSHKGIFKGEWCDWEYHKSYLFTTWLEYSNIADNLKIDLWEETGLEGGHVR